MKRWACQRCGACCTRTDLYHEDIGFPIGTYITPEERDLFPPETIQPRFAYGPDREHLTIIDYQMTQTPCPHHDPATHDCKIYDHHPLACRAYPLEISTLLQATLLDARCPAIQKRYNVTPDTEKVGTSEPGQWAGLEEAREAATQITIYQHKSFVPALLHKRWLYDFQTKEWFLIGTKPIQIEVEKND